MLNFHQNSCSSRRRTNNAGELFQQSSSVECAPWKKKKAFIQALKEMASNVEQTEAESIEMNERKEKLNVSRSLSELSKRGNNIAL